MPLRRATAAAAPRHDEVHQPRADHGDLDDAVRAGDGQGHAQRVDEQGVDGQALDRREVVEDQHGNHKEHDGARGIPYVIHDTRGETLQVRGHVSKSDREDNLLDDSNDATPKFDRPEQLGGIVAGGRTAKTEECGELEVHVASLVPRDVHQHQGHVVTNKKKAEGDAVIASLTQDTDTSHGITQNRRVDPALQQASDGGVHVVFLAARGQLTQDPVLVGLHRCLSVAQPAGIACAKLGRLLHSVRLPDAVVG
mmetsp:Transcript_56071/g.142749  ORF Transcript_56071/g.142749 Transcript_56071/m.142749 type:complete len:253 (-) Transcript_56071:236-994(-)